VNDGEVFKKVPKIERKPIENSGGSFADSTPLTSGGEELDERKEDDLREGRGGKRNY